MDRHSPLRPAWVCLAAALLLGLAGAAQAIEGTRRAELAQADEELNKAYKELQSRLSAEDQKKLLAAQRSWIAFRDADCKWAYAIQPLDCMIERTEGRTQQLRESLFVAKDGAYLSLSDAAAAAAASASSHAHRAP